MTYPRYQHLLSESAFQGICKLAIKYQYLNSENTTRRRGIGPFMCALLDSNLDPSDWMDTRPGLDPQTKLEMLENGHLGSWSEGEPRQVRTVLFPVQYQDLTAHLAYQMGVIRSEFSWHRVTKQGALISEFWEAVGLSYLTPINPPRPPKHRGKFRRKLHEIEW